jgi:hypothetical protein
MNSKIFLAIFTSFPLLIWAQPLSTVQVSPAVSVDGAITIRNQHARSITGLLLKFTFYDGFNRRAVVQPYLDVYVNHDAPIPPGGSRILAVTSSQNASKFRSQLDFASVIFDDGSIEGSIDGLSILTGRRRFLSEILGQYEVVVREMDRQSPIVTISRFDAIRASSEDAVRSKRLNADTTILVGSLVHAWLKSALGPADAPCDGACASARSRIVLAGLLNWKSHAAKGLAGSPAGGF